MIRRSGLAGNGGWVACRSLVRTKKERGDDKGWRWRELQLVTIATAMNRMEEVGVGGYEEAIARREAVEQGWGWGVGGRGEETGDRKGTHVHMHARTQARTHTHARTRTHARTHARTHTHTHTHMPTGQI